MILTHCSYCTPLRGIVTLPSHFQGAHRDCEYMDIVAVLLPLAAGALLPAARCGAPRCELVPSDSSAHRLFQDAKASMTVRADREREMLAPNALPMPPPPRSWRPRGGGGGGKRAAGGGGGGGFGATSRAAPSAAKQLLARRVGVLAEEGVCSVPGVLGAEAAADLYACVADELSRSFAAVGEDERRCISRFNVPRETFDPMRGYLLLPLRDEASE